MRRRRFLQTLLAGGTVGIAGCSDLEAEFVGQPETSTGGIARRPGKDATPRSVLPTPPTDLDLTKLRSVGETVGANAGQLATYESDDGTAYEVGVYRMENDSSATKLADRIAEQGRFYGFSVAVRHGVFIIGGGTASGTSERLVSLLVRSDALSRSFITQHDLLAE
jgi:hypothetical protein